jgi:hypothetical protein
MADVMIGAPDAVTVRAGPGLADGGFYARRDTAAGRERRCARSGARRLRARCD